MRAVIREDKLKNDKRVCPGCGKSIAGTHPKQKWCTNQCRREHARGKCIVCGGPTNYTQSPKMNRVCVNCMDIVGGPAILPTSYGRKKRVGTFGFDVMNY